jgi:TRAP-type mannitol/chloroaromatic compound transport system substrate-binding protein
MIKGKNKFNLLLAGVYTFMLIAVFSSPAAAQKTFRWTLQAHTASGDVLTAAQNFSKAVDSMSAGRLKIRVVAAGTLVPSVDTFDAVSRGTIDMTQNWGGYWIGFMPEAKVEARIPTYLTSDEYRHILYERGGIELLRKAYAKNNIMWFPAAAGADTAVWSKKPLKSMDDVRKAKIRAAGTDGLFWKKMGAATVFMPMEEIYTALALGTVDGVATSLSHYYNFKHYELCKYVIFPGFASGTLGYLINMKKWNELPEDLQAIVTYALRDNFWEGSYQAYFMDGGAKRSMAMGELETKHNVQYLEWDEEVKAQMEKVSTEMFEEFAAGSPISEELVKLITDYLKEIGRLE